ncbi:flagellar basal body-associated protein FliL [Pullulanibacillus pueri]|uniref:DUF2663 family protein n=1 Tax=Pullulanibacillus pueri TaxID=1437324 RepID=A0A8J2ZUV0_9BACL|nr:DUF2663 family protein [Pullulanibacillus pueri]MBM7681497.1 flagellar basal body-associated protein FliL [Pullulanibacillus pueri]GGH79116.1 hypothetical protein GCM10007096_13570 [Pullulanibacillus pueri]
MVDYIDQMYRNGEISEHTYYLLNKVKERKRKKDNYKKILYSLSLMVLILCAVALYTLFDGQGTQAEETISIANMLQNTFFTRILVAFLGVFTLWRFASKKYEEVDKEYEKLRIEIIERSQELWSHTYDKDSVVQAYHTLKQDYDINLYHK